MTASKYKPYPEYKDSGVEWLGRVPTGWAVLQARFTGEFKASGIDKKSIDSEDRVQMFNYMDVYRSTSKVLRYSPELMWTTASREKIKENALLDGDLLFTPSSETADDIGHCARIVDIPNNIVFSYHLLRYRPSSTVSSTFLTYLFNSKPLRGYFESVCAGTTRQVLGRDDFKESYLTVPSLVEQESITKFLDRETSRIDRLIEKKERFIELLKEKRQALITHAVTKGLPPEAAKKAGLDVPSAASAKEGPTSSSVALAKDGPPMKDSGIEWIGKVPAHWEVYPLKRELSFITSGSRGWAEFYSDGGSVFLRIGNLSRGTFDLNLSDIQKVNPPEGSEGSRTKVEKNDVLFSITAYLGSVAVVAEDLEEAYVSQHIALTRLKGNRLLPVWLGYFTLSDCGQIWLQSMSYGGTKVQLSLDDIKDMPVVVAPISEQIKIAQTLQKESETTDKLISKTQLTIDLLRERCTALITAAVTGQIDVSQSA
jgi:type I restriction enzyme S subunit